MKVELDASVSNPIGQRQRLLAAADFSGREALHEVVGPSRGTKEVDAFSGEVFWWGSCSNDNLFFAGLRYNPWTGPAELKIATAFSRCAWLPMRVQSFTYHLDVLCRRQGEYTKLSYACSSYEGNDTVIVLRSEANVSFAVEKSGSTHCAHPRTVDA